jgi:hypothetical protein
MLDDFFEHLAWRIARWYLRRRIRAAGPKLAIAGAAALLVGAGAGLVAAQRRSKRG